MLYRQLPPLNALKAFDAVVRYGAISQAALKLMVSQSSVSRHIQNLEQFLDCQLLERQKSGVVLTKDGLAFHEQTTSALSQILEASLSLRSKRSGVEVLSISSLSTFALRWLVPRLSSFQTLHPSIVIDLSISDTKPDFKKSDRDGAIISETIENRERGAVALFEEQLVLVAAPDYLKGKIINEPDLLLDESLIHVSSRTDLWELWGRRYKASKVGSKAAGMAVQDFYIAIAAAQSGIGIALVPHILVQDALIAKNLVEPLRAPLTTGRCYQLIFSEVKKNHPAACAFQDWLVTEIARDNRSKDQIN